MSLKIIKGSDQKIAVTLFRKDGCDVALPENLAGTTVTVKYKNQDDVVVTKAGPTDVTVIDAAYGKISLNLTDTDTAALAEGDFDFDVYVQEGSDTTIWQVQKKVTVVGSIA